MSAVRQFSLEAIRTDGWFERIGETIGSFQALCDIIGPRFFAFAMITGARITALTVDRRVPDNTVVDFTIGEEGDANGVESHSVTLAEFRRRLVAALVQDEPHGPVPERDTDVEGIQRHLGVRYLLLAPIFGYGLRQLHVEGDASRVTVLHDGVEESYQLTALRARLRTHVRQEYDRATRGQGQGAIDLGRVADAERAAAAGDPHKVVDLLGAWPAPLAIFLRTPEGQMLGADARATVARGLALLGSACVEFRDFEKAEEILRLAIQYAGEGQAAGDVYLRFGEALVADDRPGEAIGPLRRAIALGASPAKAWPALGGAFLARGRLLAALGAVAAGIEGGAPFESMSALREKVAQRLGPAYQAWAHLTGEGEVTIASVRPPVESESS